MTRQGFTRELRGVPIHWDREFNEHAICGSAERPIFLTADIALVTCEACSDIIDPPESDS